MVRSRFVSEQFASVWGGCLQDLFRFWDDAADALEDGIVAALDRSESVWVEEVSLHVNDQ